MSSKTFILTPVALMTGASQMRAMLDLNLDFQRASEYLASVLFPPAKSGKLTRTSIQSPLISEMRSTAGVVSDPAGRHG